MHSLAKQVERGETVDVTRAARVSGTEEKLAHRLSKSSLLRHYLFKRFARMGTFKKAAAKLDAKLDAKIPQRFGKKTRMVDDHATQLEAIREVLKIGGAYAPTEAHTTQTVEHTPIDFSGEPIAVLHYVRIYGALPSEAHRQILTEGTPEQRRALLERQPETVEGTIISDDALDDSPK